MPIQPLPDRPSLAHLQNQAQDLLKAHRTSKPEAFARIREFHPKLAQKSESEIQSLRLRLSDAQWIIARQYGFASWAKLKHHVTALTQSPSDSAPSANNLESVARDFVEVFETGEAGALQRLNQFRELQSTWDDVRADVWHNVYKVRQAKARPGSFTVADAQEFLARESGHGNWPAFVRAGGSPPAGEPYAISGPKISPRRRLSRQEWADLLAVMKERRLTSFESNGQITDDVLRQIASLDHVTQLNFDGAQQLTDDGLRHLAAMPQLQDLDLSNYPGSRITDHGLEVLQHLPALRRFKICWQPGVTDAGIAHLRACEHLELVNLMGTATGDGALEALAGRRSLHFLNTGKLVTDAGLAALHRFPVFKTWQGHALPPETRNANDCPNQILLDGPFTDAGLAQLAGLDGLFGLGFFWHAKAMTPAGLRAFGSLPHLGYLACEGELCNDEAMRHIATIPRLQILMAQGTVATDEGFVALSQSRSLERLWGRECPNLTGRGFAALARIPTLRGLGVSCQRVDQTSLASLAEFPALRELTPIDVTDEGFRAVGRCRLLESLACMYCRETTDIATGHLLGLTGLQSYYAGLTKITDLSLELLSRLESLEELEFFECRGLTDAGLPALGKLPRLRDLSIHSSPHVTLAGTKVLPPRISVSYSA